jgi:hypothetical protein
MSYGGGKWNPKTENFFKIEKNIAIILSFFGKISDLAIFSIPKA